MFTQPQLERIARSVAASRGLDPALVCALCHHESENWQQFAVRYEHGYYERYVSTMTGLTPTEMQMRATSFGLMQVMGQTAREFGFTGQFLTELFEPETCVRFGCAKLKRELEKSGGDVRKALLGYNGGGDASYPDKVLQHYARYKQ